ncbi:RNA polymerase sigma factor [Sphingobacterium sp. SGR-19]|uniref:RNA polymerase sigma factor n=1 Tax=Sphingobacterium sp. SGR-19 TaxID=2710886 RepID=UPI0013E9B8DA|nr:sigma-70 family RNA polymerase sigma factor [Sphingobacterium sp. SGR-19]NGM65763.1 sigma-70 family RNA polymerase sigma factor [Sphingobacterium sp. SGR-19]
MEASDKHISDLRKGKETALGFLMDQLADALHFFAYSFIKDKQTASEIVSDAFVKLWERRTHFEAMEPVKSFLYLVVKNACLDHLKLSRNKFRHEEADVLEIEAPDQDILRNIIYTELVELIVNEVKKLPRQQLQVVQLSIMEGKNIQEVCDELGTTANTVYFARSKAIAALRAVLRKKKLSLHYLLW